MDACPNCNDAPGLGWHKATLSPLISIPCKHCDIELTVSWKSYLLSVLPASIVFLVGYLYTEDSSFEQYIVIGCSILLMTLCQLIFMPIEIKLSEESN